MDKSPLLKNIESLQQMTETQEGADAYSYLKDFVVKYENGDYENDGMMHCLMFTIDYLISQHDE